VQPWTHRMAEAKLNNIEQCDTHLDDLRCKVPSFHHGCAACVQIINDVLMADYLSLKRLVLLDLSRQVRQFLPCLFRRSLQLLLNPRLQLVCRMRTNQ